MQTRVHFNDADTSGQVALRHMQRGDWFLFENKPRIALDMVGSAGRSVYDPVLGKTYTFKKLDRTYTLLSDVDIATGDDD